MTKEKILEIVRLRNSEKLNSEAIAVRIRTSKATVEGILTKLRRDGVEIEKISRSSDYQEALKELKG